MRAQMTSRERLLATIERRETDHPPIYCWSFGFRPPPELRWKRNGRDVIYWYSLRLEHIHTLPASWDLEDDFRRIQAWAKLGVDDILEVSIPWSVAPEVRIRDWREDDVMCRCYETPAGPLIQKVRETKEQIPPGWVIQPQTPQLFEDLNLPRSVRFPVTEPSDVPKLKHLLRPPTRDQLAHYRERMAATRKFAAQHGALTLGWPAYGMDGVVWLMGVDGAVMAAMTEPEFFQEVVNTVSEFDRMRTDLMMEVGGVDVIVQRGWYGSTDFWSPALFRKFTQPNVKTMANLVHRNGLKFGYVNTTGVMTLLDDLAEAGMDLLYYVDPVQDHLDLRELKRKLRGRLTVVGGINSSLTLGSGSTEDVRQAVFRIAEEFGTRGIIIAAVDALFPETPWENVQTMIEAWNEVARASSP